LFDGAYTLHTYLMACYVNTIVVGQALNAARPSKIRPPLPNYRPGRAATSSKGSKS